MLKITKVISIKIVNNNLLDLTQVNILTEKEIQTTFEQAILNESRLDG